MSQHDLEAGQDAGTFTIREQDAWVRFRTKHEKEGWFGADHGISRIEEYPDETRAIFIEGMRQGPNGKG